MKIAISLPKKLTTVQRRKIKEHYNALKIDVDRDLERIVLQRIPRVFKRLTMHQNSFKYALASVGRALFECYAAVVITKKAEFHLSAKGRSSILAALSYLCEPQDVIPDYVPGIGLIDDAHVMNLVIRELSRTDPDALEYVSEFLRRDDNVVN